MGSGVKKLSTGQMVICASVAGALGGVAGNPAGKSSNFVEQLG